MQKDKKKSSSRRIGLALALSIILLVGLAPLGTSAFMQSYLPSTNTYGLPSFNNLFGTNSAVPSYGTPNTSLYGSTNTTTPSYNNVPSSLYGQNNNIPNSNPYQYNTTPNTRFNSGLNNSLNRGSSLYSNPYTNNSTLGRSNLLGGTQANPYNYNRTIQGQSGLSVGNRVFGNSYNSNPYNTTGGAVYNNPYNYNAPLNQGSLNSFGSNTFAPNTFTTAKVSGAANSPYSYILTGYNDLIGARGGYYTVQRGDTVSKIARRFGVTTGSITTANSLRNPNLIHSGQRLLIPSASNAFYENCRF